MGEAMVVIREYATDLEALVARSVLDAHSIPALVWRLGAEGELPARHLLYPMRLAVRAAEVPQALRILEASASGDDTAFADRYFDAPPER